jgi:RimJ/RimL family protein N-acetyltransferase
MRNAVDRGRRSALRRGLTEPSLEAVLDFCARDPVERVFLEDVARRGFGRFHAVERGGRVVALCHLGANLVPSGEGCAAFARLVERSLPRMIIGDERAVTDVWTAVGDRVAAPREDRPGQPVYLIVEPPEPGGTELREARIDDLGLLVPACAATHAEELGIDPLERDPEGFRWRTRTQIDEGRSWLWREDGTILFKAEASAWTPHAVQIQQVWVDPQVRNRGYAQRGMRDLCRLLLRRVPRVCLFVRTDNAPAQRVYEAIGMRRVGSYRSLLF